MGLSGGAVALPEDKQWAQDRVTILQALGVQDPDGNPTGRVDVVKAADVARLTQEDWQESAIKCSRPARSAIRVPSPRVS
ncbi:MAG: hypothetical protein ACUVSV_10025 [Armatimonadota bacterium]